VLDDFGVYLRLERLGVAVTHGLFSQVVADSTLSHSQRMSDLRVCLAFCIQHLQGHDFLPAQASAWSAVSAHDAENTQLLRLGPSCRRVVKLASPKKSTYTVSAQKDL
jgi:hypothetical protein